MRTFQRTMGVLCFVSAIVAPVVLLSGCHHGVGEPKCVKIALAPSVLADANITPSGSHRDPWLDAARSAARQLPASEQGIVDRWELLVNDIYELELDRARRRRNAMMDVLTNSLCAVQRREIDPTVLESNLHALADLLGRTGEAYYAEVKRLRSSPEAVLPEAKGAKEAPGPY